MSNRNSKLSVQNWTTDSITPSSSLSFSCWQHFVLHPSVCLAGPTLKISFLDALSPSWFCSQVFLITLLPFSLESVWHPGDTLMSTQAWSLWHKGSEKQSSSSPVQDTQHQHPTVPCSDASRNACPILLHASCTPSHYWLCTRCSLISTDPEGISLISSSPRVVSWTLHWIPFLLDTLWSLILFYHLCTIK